MKKKYKSIALFATANLLISPVITTYAQESLTKPELTMTEEEVPQKN